MVERALADAGHPLTLEQERAIILMMEDRRQAAEDLFRQTMDFRSGPTQGQQVDQANDAIQWMREEFMWRLKDFLTPEQHEAWGRFEEEGVWILDNGGTSSAGAAPRQQQTQYVRINNNAFTAESSNYSGGFGGRQPEVIQRGGTGAYHGNAQFTIRDAALNARNPFAHNRPPYQEHQSRFDVSGPLLPGRLTAAFAANQNKSENVDTIHATTPTGLFDLGIVRPQVQRFFTTRGTYQLAEAHSLNYNLQHRSNTRQNEGVGGFNLPERASDSYWRSWNLELRQFSAVSSRTIYETAFSLTTNNNRTIPFSDGLQTNVLDAFRSGGAQNREESTGNSYSFSNLFTRLGESLTVKTGMDGTYRTARSLSEDNFTGAFTFSSLEAYLAGQPLNYRVNRGDPLLESSQSEFSLFIQNDLKLTPRLTFMFGVRYEVQTNLRDYNNLAPRLGFAYAMGRATVIRAGAGIFHQRLGFNNVQTQMRQDGTRQFEVVIDNPSYPDPFQGGTVRNTRPSVRVTDPNLVAPYNGTASVSLERTFLSTLLTSVMYEFNRGLKRYQVRNLNAPMDLTKSVPGSCSPETPADMCVRPEPDRGNIWNLENTGNALSHNLRLEVRQRFSIFNVSGSYRRSWAYDDGQGNNLNSYPSDNYDLRADWSRTPSPRHQFNGTVNARMPLGVFLTGSFSGSADTAYTVTTGRDDNRDSVVNDRPPGIGRFTERGPGHFKVDFNISKAFFLGGTDQSRGSRTNINMFANMSNAFNTPQLNRPSGVLSSPNFGRSTSASEPREIEVGLRFQF